MDMIEYTKILEKGKVMVNGKYYNYEFLSSCKLPCISGIISNDLYNEIMKKIFQKNQKAIDSSKTTKERRKQLISFNQDILNYFGNNK